MANNIQPHDINAEKALIGAILIDDTIITEAVIQLKPSDFYLKLHEIIFETLIKLYTENKPIDMIIVSTQLAANPIFIEVAGIKYLTVCIDSVKTTAFWEEHVKIIREKSALRSLLRHSQNISKKILTGEEQYQHILDFAQNKINEVVLGNINKNGFETTLNLAAPMITKIEHLYDNKQDVSGVSTGFIDIDKKTGGLPRGELIIVAGRPSMGKSTFAINIALNIAKKPSNKAVAIFSLEMSKENLMIKFLSNITTIDSRNLSQGKVQKTDFSEISTGTEIISKSKIYIDDSSDLNILECRAKSRHLYNLLKTQNIDLEVIVVDYIQMMRGVGDEDNRREEVDYISRNLKALAKELNIPIIAISQLSRATEDRSRKNKRPLLSDLKESGGLEQDADIVMFVFRPGYYDWNDPSIQNDVTIIVAKNRNGAVGDVDMIFEKEFSKFSDKIKINYD